MLTDAKSTSRNSQGRKIQVLSARLEDAMNRRLKEHGLSLRQFAVLMTVLGEDDLTQVEIGKRFSMPPHAISRAIDYLERQDLVQRRPHETSRRAVIVTATKKGQRLAPALLSVVNEVNSELLSPLTDAERNEFSRLLSKIVDS